MKKTFLLLALVCVLVLLAACDSKPAPTEPAPTEKSGKRPSHPPSEVHAAPPL